MTVDAPRDLWFTEDGDQTRPWDQAEISVLGGMLIDEEGLNTALEKLEASAFQRRKHRVLFRAMSTISERGEAVDVVSLGDELERTGTLEAAGGQSYLAELLDAVPTAANIETHANIVREWAARREIRDTAERLQRDAVEGEQEPASILAIYVEEFERLEANGAGGPAELPVLSGEDLFEATVPEPEWTVEEVLLRGRQGTVYGPPSVGKSMLMRHLVGAVATGGRALGEFGTRQGLAFWVTAEEAVDDMQRGTAAAAEGDGFDLQPVLENLRVAPLREHHFSLSEPAHRRWLERRIEELGPEIVVLDTLSNLAGADLKDDEEMTPILRWGSRVSSKFDTCVLWLAHDKKDREASDIDALFGSRQNSALMDFAYRLVPARGGNVVLRCVKMRGTAAPEEIHLEVAIVSYRMHSMRVQKAPEFTMTAEEVRQQLTDNPGMTMSDLRDTVAEEVKRRPADVGKDVKTLMEQGKVENRGTEHRFELHWSG